MGNAGYLSFDQYAGFCTAGPYIYHSDIAKDKWIACTTPPTETCITISAVNLTVAYAAAFSGSIYKTSDGGISFYKVGALPGNMPGYFLDLAFLDEQNGYASQGRKLYKTVDGGKTWTTEIVLASDAAISELHFNDAGHGWACGIYGNIFVFRG